MTELKPVPSIEDEIEKLAEEAFPMSDWPETHTLGERYACADALRSLIPIVRREAMRECLEDVDAVSCEFDVALAVTKRRGDTCREIAKRIKQRMEGQ